MYSILHYFLFFRILPYFHLNSNLLLFHLLFFVFLFHYHCICMLLFGYYYLFLLIVFHFAMYMCFHYIDIIIFILSCKVLYNKRQKNIFLPFMLFTYVSYFHSLYYYMFYYFHLSILSAKNGPILGNSSKFLFSSSIKSNSFGIYVSCVHTNVQLNSLSIT